MGFGPSCSDVQTLFEGLHCFNSSWFQRICMCRKGRFLKYSFPAQHYVVYLGCFSRMSGHRRPLLSVFAVAPPHSVQSMCCRSCSSDRSVCDLQPDCCCATSFPCRRTVKESPWIASSSAAAAATSRRSPPSSMRFALPSPPPRPSVRPSYLQDLKVICSAGEHPALRVAQGSSPAAGLEGFHEPDLPRRPSGL